MIIRVRHFAGVLMMQMQLSVFSKHTRMVGRTFL